MVKKEEHLSLMVRIFAEQDLEKIPEPVYKAPINPLLEKRYYLTIVCEGIKNDPIIQVFKGHDFMDNNKQKTVYYTVIDTDNVNILNHVVSKYFINGIIIGNQKFTLAWKPLQYLSIWEDKTKLY